MHHFSSPKRSLSCAMVVMETKALVPNMVRLPKQVPHLNPTGAVLIFPPPTAVLYGDGEGPSASLPLISLLLFAQVGPETLSDASPPTHNPQPSAFIVFHLSSPPSLCVFVPRGAVVPLELLVTQRNLNWLSSAACCQLWTLCCCSACGTSDSDSAFGGFQS